PIAFHALEHLPLGELPPPGGLQARYRVHGFRVLRTQSNGKSASTLTANGPSGDEVRPFGARLIYFWSMGQTVRHLLSAADLSREEIFFLLDAAAALKRRPQRLLEGRELALLFEKPSLRTRVSFQVAMRHLGGETIYLAPQEVGLGEREAIKDVSRVLARYVDIVAVRTYGQEIVEEYAEYSDIPVINALTNEEHPCQALADLLTVREKLGNDLRGRSIAFVGDGNNVA